VRREKRRGEKRGSREEREQRREEENKGCVVRMEGGRVMLKRKDL
jgi:hypothetical protein